MELESIAKKLENKSILITGSTGYLAKLVVEKVLRVQPNVKKLFLLVRATDAVAAKQRLETQVLQLDLFKVLREKYEGSFESLFWSKVTAVPGDVAVEGLGIRDEDLKEVIWRHTNIIINSAASTNFNERYDVALGINTFGVKNILAFSVNCLQLEILIHVSTAYVTKKRSGIILEQPLPSDEGYENLSISSIKMEAKLAEEKLKELKNNKVSPEVAKASMKEMGMKRANAFGWPNVYSFTKAMGEVLLCHLSQNIPVVILRPTIITSTFVEPFPGWIEGVRTMDSFVVAYAKGHINCCLSGNSVVLDLVPGDMVMNALLATLPAHAGQQMVSIYHIGSSLRNPIKICIFRHIALRYFSAKPYIGKDGRPTNCRNFFLLSMNTFHLYMFLLYKIPLMVLWVIRWFFSHRLQNKYNKLSSKYKQTITLAKAYEPYTTFEGSFDDYNLQKLEARMTEKDKEIFFFDTKCIDWDNYLTKAHIPGILKYGMKTN